MHWKKDRLYREYSPLEDRFYRFIAINLRKVFSYGCQQLICHNNLKLFEDIKLPSGVWLGAVPQCCSWYPVSSHLVGARHPARAQPSHGDLFPLWPCPPVVTAKLMGSMPGPGESKEEAWCRNAEGDQSSESCSGNNEVVSHWCHTPHHQSLAQHTETFPGVLSLGCIVL